MVVGITLTLPPPRWDDDAITLAKGRVPIPLRPLKKFVQKSPCDRLFIVLIGLIPVFGSLSDLTGLES